MTTIIDQAPSEIRLHRVFYLIKLLRAMLINNVLNVATLLIYFFFGVKGLYFSTDDMLSAIHDQMVAMQRAGFPAINSFVPLIVVFVLLFLVILFVWTYLSIVRVMKISLRIQSITFIIVAIAAPLSVLPLIRFSIYYFNP